MSRFNWLGPRLAAACLVALTLSSTFWAQEPPPAKHDAHVLRESLKDVINHGAELFNRYGDHAGCYRLYQGALLAIKPFLPAPQQEELTRVLGDAESLPRYSDRAFALRKMIDTIRAPGGRPPAGTPEK